MCRFEFTEDRSCVAVVGQFNDSIDNVGRRHNYRDLLSTITSPIDRVRCIPVDLSTFSKISPLSSIVDFLVIRRASESFERLSASVCWSALRRERKSDLLRVSSLIGGR